MSLSSLRLPTPKASRSNLHISTAPVSVAADDDVQSVHSDASSFFDVEGVATTTTGSESRPEDEFDFVSDTEEETGDEL